MNGAVASGLIEPAALLALMQAGTKNLKILDCTYVIAGTGPHGREDFTRRRIGEAVFFDIDEVADRSSALPHMLPSQKEFEDGVSALGISNDDFIVAYSQAHMGMAPARVWWMFRLFGHENICVLNGGLQAWVNEGLPLETSAPVLPRPARFQAKAAHMDRVCGMDDVRSALEGGSALVLDARPAGRFGGQDPEPRPGLHRGHMPGSRNLPGPALLDAKTGKMKSQEEIRALFSESGFKPGLKTVTSCGSGAVACLLILALHYAGGHTGVVYDGSWAEWGQEKLSNPVASGL